MKYCSECGCDNPDEAQFCRNCGHTLINLTDSIEPVQKQVKPQEFPSKVIVNQNNDSIISKIFFKVDKYTGELRIAKTKTISVAVFVLMFLFCFAVNWGGPFIPMVLASVVFGLMFAIPTLIIGYILGIISDRISH